MKKSSRLKIIKDENDFNVFKVDYMADRLMYIPMMMHKITSFLDYNQWLKRLDTQLNKPTKQNSMKVPKVIKKTNEKILI